MKQLLLLLSAIFCITSCNESEERAIYQETGVVVNYAGAEHCGIVIELDNGQKIQPLHYPENLVFVQGQQLLVTYSELPNVVSTCGKGVACDILQAEELSCGAPLSEKAPEEINQLPNDPVILHEVTMEGDCLHLKVAYSGGCRNHTFDLVQATGNQQEETTAVLELRHDANGDVCEALLSMDLRFSISALTDQGYTQFYFKALLENGETYRELIELEN